MSSAPVRRRKDNRKKARVRLTVAESKRVERNMRAGRSQLRYQCGFRSVPGRGMIPVMVFSRTAMRALLRSLSPRALRIHICIQVIFTPVILGVPQARIQLYTHALSLLLSTAPSCRRQRGELRRSRCVSAKLNICFINL